MSTNEINNCVVYITQDEAEDIEDTAVRRTITHRGRWTVTSEVVGEHPVHGLVSFTVTEPATEDQYIDDRYILGTDEHDQMVRAELVSAIEVVAIEYLPRGTVSSVQALRELVSELELERDITAVVLQQMIRELPQTVHIYLDDVSIELYDNLDDIGAVIEKLVLKYKELYS